MSSEGGSVLARAVVVLEGDSKKLEEMMSESEKKMKKLGEGMKDLGEHLTTHLTLELVAMGTEAVMAFGEQEDAMARTNAILKATGESAGVTSDHIQTLADQLQDATRFSNDVTTSAAGMLLTFEQVQNRMGKGNDIFDRTIKSSQDLASLLGGDLNGAVMMLGKALEDPTNGMMMLRRAGITFTATQQEMIKNMYANNDVLGAQKMLLDIVQTKIGGLAKAMAKTPLGQFKQAWNAIQDAMKPFGAIIMKAITPVLEGVEKLAKWFQNLSETTKTAIVIFAGVVAILGPLLVVIGTLTTAWAIFAAVVNISFLPFLLIVAGVALVIAALYELVAHWTWIELKAAEFWKWLKDLFFSGFDALVGAVQWYVQAVAAQFDLLKNLPGKLGEIGAALAAPFDAAADGITAFRDSLHAAQQVSDAMSDQTIARLTKKLKEQEEQAKKTGKAIHTNATAKPLPPTWLGPATAALNDLQAALKTASDKESVLGEAFDETSAQAQAYSAAVDALLKGHVPLTAAINATGDSVKSFMLTMQQLQGQAAIDKLGLDIEAAAKQAAVLGDSFDYTAARASAYESLVSTLIGLHVDLDAHIGHTGLTLRQFMLDMQQAKIAQIGNDLNNALKAVKIQSAGMGASFDATGAKISAYESAIQSAIAAHLELTAVIEGTGMSLGDLMKALEKLKEQQEIANKIKDTFASLGDFFVDWAFGAKKSFSEFVRSALADLTKLIIKMLWMKALKQIFDPKQGGIMGDIGTFLGFADGGFIQGGTVGLVGERGPELISGGRNGVSITPIPASNSSVSYGGDTMHVEVNVNAIDSKGVDAFFKENTDQVAGAMIRARAKSMTLRRMMGG